MIFLSVVILVTSLLHNANRDAVNAEQLHRSALEINELYRELLAQGHVVGDENIKLFTERYNAVLQKYSVNHDEMDYLKYRITRPENFPWMTRRERMAKRLWLVLTQNTPIICLLAITLAVLWLVFSYALPARMT